MGMTHERRFKALDLYCGAGGVSMGLHRAGFEVVGVDIEPQPRYPFEFVEADALTFDLTGFDFVWASPPCQAYGTFANVNRARGRGEPKAPKLIEPTRARLRDSGAAYVMENTERAPLLSPIKLCGSAFGLRVRRHRLFESNVFLFGQPCRHNGHRSWDYVGVYGSTPGGGYKGADGYERTPRAGSLDEAREAMGIDWMLWDELTQAIPPAYAHFLGLQVISYLTELAERAA